MYEVKGGKGLKDCCKFAASNLTNYEKNFRRR